MKLLSTLKKSALFLAIAVVFVSGATSAYAAATTLGQQVLDPNSTCLGTLVSGSTTYTSIDAIAADPQYSDYNTPGKYCFQDTHKFGCNGGASTNPVYSVYLQNGTSPHTAPADTCSTVDGAPPSQIDRAVATTYVNPYPKVAKFVAGSSSIVAGNSTNLTWSTNSMQTCSSTDIPNFPTFTTTNGNVTVTPSHTTIYHLSCNGYNVTVNKTATVTVSQPLSDSIACTVNPASPLSVNTNTTLTATLSGSSGVFPFTYVWNGPNVNWTTTASSRSSATSTAYASNGTKNTAVTVTDSSSSGSSPTRTLTPNGVCSPESGMIASYPEDTEDGGTMTQAQTDAKNYAMIAYGDPNFGTADFHAHPENYCVFAYVYEQGDPSKNTFGTGGAPFRIDIGLYHTTSVQTATPPTEHQAWYFSDWWGSYTQAIAGQTSSGSSSGMCTVTVKGPPTPPTITKGVAPGVTCDATHPASGPANQSINFNVSGSDPSGENVRYGIVTNGATTTEIWSGYDVSGWTYSFTRKWTTPGSYILAAQTENTPDLLTSDWAYCPITIGTFPDLTAADVTPSGAVTGTVQLAALISDATADTGAAFTDLFQMASSTAGTNSQDIGTFANSALSASASNSATLNKFFSPGTYYLRACADKSSAGDTGVITESNETNNCSPDWTQFTVCSAGQTWNGTACVTSTPTPTCSLNASPNPIPTGQTTAALTWSSTNATSCSSSDFTTGGATSYNGSGITKAAGTYNMTCTGAGGTGGCSVTVTGPGGACTADNTVDLKGTPLINGAPGTLSDGPIRVHVPAANCSGSSCNNVQLHFGQINVSPATGSCRISRSDGGSTITIPGGACKVAGTDQPVSVTTQTKFTLACDGVAGTDSVIVNIIPAFQEF